MLEDIDEIRDRKLDITLSDGYDAKTDGLFTDYVNLIERLISLGDRDEVIRDRINKILEEYTPRRFSTEEVKKNIDILKNTFKIVKVVQIQRKDDNDSISGKMGDFTSETINKLLQDGFHDALSKYSGRHFHPTRSPYLYRLPGFSYNFIHPSIHYL